MSRLVTAFSLLSLVTVSTVGAIAFFRARLVIKNLVFERLEVTATLKEEALNLWVENQREATVSLAQLPEIRQQAEVILTGNKTEPDYSSAYRLLKQYLMSAIASRSELAEVFILTDIGGKIIISTNQDSEETYQVKAKYFTEGRQQTFVQNVYPSSSTGQPTMTIATPIFSEYGKRIGILASHLKLDKMDRIVLENTGLGKSGESYLVDQFNLFVSGTRFGREKFPRGVHSPGINAALKEKDGSGVYRNYEGVLVIGVYRWLEDRDLALLVEIHQKEAFIPARKLAWTIFCVGTILAGLLTGIVYLLARQIARPILAIASTAIEVADGNLSPVAPILTEDEVGTLATAFNQMTKQLQVLYQGLEEKVAQLQAEQEKSESLLLNILPEPIANRLKQNPQIIAESFAEVTVLFADLVGFTKLSSRVTPTELVESLNTIFSAFDALAENYGLEKIKTIGDAYMVVGGLPTPRTDHAEAIAYMALDMQMEIRQISNVLGEALNIRIGINSGPVLAGVIGLKKFSYDLWGDTVNTASRMEYHGIPGCIQVSAVTYEKLRAGFILKKRGMIDIKGKGQMTTYLLLGRNCNGTVC